MRFGCKMDSELNITGGVKILYEDNHLIVAVKPAGILSQSDGSDAPQTRFGRDGFRENVQSRIPSF